MARIVIVGEGMIELGRRADAGWQVGYGGDTLNTAIHLARLGHDVAFLTAIGDDPFSDELRKAWISEGIDPTLLLTDSTRRAGLYAITNDADGERHFTYWRGESAARRLFDHPEIDAATAIAATADLLVFSMITLAILPPAGRAALLALAGQVHANGGRVAFDTNYRPALWPNHTDASGAHAAALFVTDIGLPTIEDERMLTSAAKADDVAAHWRAAGVNEVAIKQGGLGCQVDGLLVRPQAMLQPSDTSGAGDAFNAGYLHARLAGLAPHEAANAGHCLAGWVVMRCGAIPPADADAPYAKLLAQG